MEKVTIIDVSWRTLVKVVILAAAAWLVWEIRTIIGLIFLVLVLVAALSPVVDRWSTRLPRPVAVASLFLIIGLLISSIGALIVPPLVVETHRLAVELPGLSQSLTPSFFNDLRTSFDIDQNLVQGLSQSLSKVANSLYIATRGVFGGLVTIITVAVMVFYLLLEQHGATKFLVRHLPIEQRNELVRVLQKIGLKMGNWLRGQVLVSLIVGFLVWIALLIVGVPYAVTLAVLTGLLDFIPIVGPLIALIPMVIFALTISPLTAAVMVVIFLILQQLEGHILIPRIIGKSLGLSPVLIIIAILVGAQLAGLTGVILAVPAAGVVAVVVQEWPLFKESFIFKVANTPTLRRRG